MKNVFAPGCALYLYKPELVYKLHKVLEDNLGPVEILEICCKNHPELEEEARVINICPGCDKRFRENYTKPFNISLWEILAESNFFPFPNYNGKRMTIIDACPTRSEDRIHNAIRTLIKKMNIKLIEPENTRTKSTCCGDSYWGVLPKEDVKKQMIKKASEMPLDDIIVYCVSCCKAMFVGGKQPHYMIDLLFNEETLPKTYDTEKWHKELDKYISEH